MWQSDPAHPILQSMASHSARRIRIGVATAAAAAGLAVAIPTVAGAAFPGSNGNLVFQSTQPGILPCPPLTSTELFSIAPTGGAVSQVDCSGNTDQHAFGSPDGSEVIFASDRIDGSSFSLFTESVSGTGLTSVSQNLPNGASDDYPSWAPASPGNQNGIIFQRTLPLGQPQIYTENITVPNSIVPVFADTTGFSDSQPVYDPSNGNEIAFTRTYAGQKSRIFTYNLATHVLTDLSTLNGDTNSNDSKPDFAPGLDGSGHQLILFQSDRATPAAGSGTSNGPCVGPQLYTMTDQTVPNAIIPVLQTWSGGMPTGIQKCASVTVGTTTTLVADLNPVFSPDGSQVAFDQSGTPGYGITTQDVFTGYDVPFLHGAAYGAPTDLTPNFATDGAPTWLPVQPGVSTPEAPATLFLPLAALGLFGGGVLVVRRRRRLA